MLKDIAQELNVNPKMISKWKKQDAWALDRSPTALKKKGGAPKGNRNAAGNTTKGKAPKGSKRALKTGEYETILLNTLTDEERGLIPRIQLDKILVMREELMLLTIRERRMMQRIDDLLRKSNNGMGIAKIVETKGSEPDHRGRIRDTKSTSTEVLPILNAVQRIEEALTRVQMRKQMVVDQLHKIENDDRQYELALKRLELDTMRVENATIVPATEDTDDGFMAALEAKVTEVWDDEPDED
jgi:uncharacterized protein YjcR